MVELILETMGRPQDAYELVPDRPGHDLRNAIDSTKLRTELGWTPAYANFEEGLANTVKWYLDHEHWWRPQKAAAEARYKEQGQ